ncbi:uncharacterized protein LOC144300571 [Canis aureus]
MIWKPQLSEQPSLEVGYGKGLSPELRNNQTELEYAGRNPNLRDRISSLPRHCLPSLHGSSGIQEWRASAVGEGKHGFMDKNMYIFCAKSLKPYLNGFAWLRFILLQ